jgi:hypothetical protein
MLPARATGPLEPLGRPRSGTDPAVHAAPSIRHGRGLTGRAAAGLGTASGGRIGVSHRVAVF